MPPLVRTAQRLVRRSLGEVGPYASSPWIYEISSGKSSMMLQNYDWAGASNMAPQINNNGWVIGSKTSLYTWGEIYIPVPEPSGLIAVSSLLMGVCGVAIRTRY